MGQETTHAQKIHTHTEMTHKTSISIIQHKIFDIKKTARLCYAIEPNRIGYATTSARLQSLRGSLGLHALFQPQLQTSAEPCQMMLPSQGPQSSQLQNYFKVHFEFQISLSVIAYSTTYLTNKGTFKNRFQTKDTHQHRYQNMMKKS